MENLLEIIFIFTIIKFSCKATFYRKYWGILLFAISAGAFAFAVHPFVIRNNLQVFTTIFSEKAKVTDLAIIITVEAISGIMGSIAVLQNLVNPKRKNWVAFLKLSPGIIIAGAIFYIELKAFYFFPGINFWITALIISSGLFLLTGVLSVAIKTILPMESMRYELKFFINIVLLIVAVVLNAGLADYNQGSYHSELALPGLVVFLLLGAGLGIIGYFIQKIKNKGKLKNLNKWI
jgi:hypothetical protein